MNKLKEESNCIVKSLENLKSNIDNINKNCKTFDPREYIQGLYNGYEIALSLLESRKPELKDVENVEFNDIFHTGIDIDCNICEKDIDDNEEINIESGYQGFEKYVKGLINSNCIENYSNTPDFIIAEFLTDTLKTFEKIIKLRDKWYGFDPWPENKIDLLTVGVKITDLPVYDGIMEIIQEFALNDSIPEKTRSYFKNRFNELFNNFYNTGDNNNDNKDNE